MKTTPFYLLFLLVALFGCSKKDDNPSARIFTDLEKVGNADFSVRFGHTATAFEGKLWVIGARVDGGPSLNDVWYSEDGKNWTEATANAAFPPRYSHTTTVFNNKLWVIGGTNGSDFKNDVSGFEFMGFHPKGIVTILQVENFNFPFGVPVYIAMA